jgi:CRISPR-associated protein Csd2
MSLNHRYEFVYLFDVKDGNPNGDPDAGNLPRVDAETGQGLVTDVCLKRKVRNYVGLVKGYESPFDIYVKERTFMNETHGKAYSKSEELRAAIEKLEEAKALKKPGKNASEDEKQKYRQAQEYIRSVRIEDIAKKWVEENFFDVRTFGAVMSTSDKESELSGKAGQVRGPVQINFARSVDPVMASEHAIAVTAARKTDKPYNEQIGIQGRKFTIPYGLYRCHGFISANLAKQTGFGEQDLELLWDALINMLDHDRSASRGEMSPCGLYVFKHDSPLGNAPARKLFELIDVNRISEAAARDFNDYQVSIREDQLPSGVQLIKYLE